MYRAILESINGVEIWPIIAILIFMTIFTIVLVWTIRLDKGTVDEMANIPLSDTQNGNKTAH